MKYAIVHTIEYFKSKVQCFFVFFSRWLFFGLYFSLLPGPRSNIEKTSKFAQHIFVLCIVRAIYIFLWVFMSDAKACIFTKSSTNICIYTKSQENTSVLAEHMWMEQFCYISYAFWLCIRSFRSRCKLIRFYVVSAGTYIHKKSHKNIHIQIHYHNTLLICCWIRLFYRVVFALARRRYLRCFRVRRENFVILVNSSCLGGLLWLTGWMGWAGWVWVELAVFAGRFSGGVFA